MVASRQGQPDVQRARRTISASGTVHGFAVAVLGAGVVSQFLQRTDPVFPLRYYTVCSAVVAMISLAPGVLGRGVRWSTYGRSAGMSSYGRSAGVTGVVLSSAVYAMLIAPNSPTGSWIQPHDDAAARVAIVLLHAVGPAAAVLAFLVGYDAPSVPGQRPIWMWAPLWPWLYAVATWSVAAAGLAPIPYPFMDAHVVGLSGLLITTVGFTALSLVIARALHGSSRLMPRAWAD